LQQMGGIQDDHAKKQAPGGLAVREPETRHGGILGRLPIPARAAVAVVGHFRLWSIGGIVPVLD
jgi:hypothetical protein